MARKTKIGYLYAIQGDECVKIGCSTNPEKRVKHLMSISGLNGNYYISRRVIDMYGYEKSIHDKLINKRNVGEWFDVDFSVAVDAINDKCKETTDQQLAMADDNEKLMSNELSKAYEKSIEDIVMRGINTNQNESLFDELLKSTIYLAESINDASFIDRLNETKKGCITELLAIRSIIQSELIKELNEAINYYSSQLSLGFKE